MDSEKNPKGAGRKPGEPTKQVRVPVSAIPLVKTMISLHKRNYGLIKGNFMPVEKNGEILGFIHRMYDGTYAATVVGVGNKTKGDTLDDLAVAIDYIHTQDRLRWGI